jgi:hypothetical protein
MSYPTMFNIYKSSALSDYAELFISKNIYLHNHEIDFQDKIGKKYLINIFGYNEEAKPTCSSSLFNQVCNTERISVFLIRSRFGMMPKKEDIIGPSSAATMGHSNLMFVNRQKKEIFVYEPRKNDDTDSAIYLDYLAPGFLRRNIVNAIKQLAPSAEWKVYKYNDDMVEPESMKFCFLFLEKLLNLENMYDWLDEEKNKDEALKLLKKTKKRTRNNTKKISKLESSIRLRSKAKKDNLIRDSLIKFKLFE